MADRHALLTEILTLPASFPAADGTPLAAMLDHLKCRDDGHGERVGRLAAQLGELLDSGIEASVLYLAGACTMLASLWFLTAFSTIQGLSPRSYRRTS